MTTGAQDMKDNVSSDDLVQAPNSMTPPAWSFHAEYERLCEFVFYVTDVATHSDDVRKKAIRLLFEEEDPERCRRELEEIERDGALRMLKQQHSTLILEMMLSRAAENFLSYLTELLVMIFRFRPEMLRSSETVRLDEILRHASMADLIHALAERRVNQLSYQGMRDLSRYLSDRLGFDLPGVPEDLEHIVGIIEARNIIVHNRGIVNELFLKRVKSSSAKIGERLHLDSNQMFDDLDFTALTVIEIDARAVQKFGLTAVSRPVLTSA